MVFPGGKMRVWMETPDGMMLEVDALAVNIEMMLDPYGPALGGFARDTNNYIRSRMELEILGPLTWTEKKDFASRTQARRSAREYQCSWCGQINDIGNKCCSHCGGSRDFLLD